SLKLLQKVKDVLDERGYSICNIDSTVIAQEPKLRPYIDTMRQNIAEALKIDVSQVSVKATTEEHLGFTGRKEGIAAQAIVLIDF
ncbi:MAG: 2-C-methyl-D-erythritol 2,4-cyclodiphosphate synthase, partial [Lachnospiraceae bacterium]|nr:2-C-methyl-D-erythritol 2,4-cyclodiphosphate synthase [Lachnospiraceae bacterium]